MIKLTILIALISSTLYGSNLPKMGFEKSFYIENTCDSFKYNKENKDFNPKECFKKKDNLFKLDYCTIVDNGILCISSKKRTNFFLKVNIVEAENLLIIKEKIIEVTKIVYQGNTH